MQFSLIAIPFFLSRIFMANAQNSFIPFASKSNDKPDSEITQYKPQKVNQKFVEMNPENDWQVVYRYYRPPAAEPHQTETETSTKYEKNNSSSETSTKRQSLVNLKKPPESKDHAIYVYPKGANAIPNKVETTTKKPSLVILKRPFEGKDLATYVYPNAAFANANKGETTTKRQSLIILRRPPDGKDHVTYFYPNAAYANPQLTTEGPYTTADAYATEDYATTTTEAYTTTTTEAATTTTTEAYTTTTTTDGSPSSDDAKQADDNPQVKIGDILSIPWANAVCMAMINAVTLGTIWLGGELSWVGRSSSSSHFGPEVNKWLLRSVSLNEDEHAGALQSMCVQRAACEAPRAALLYLDTKGHLTRLLSYFTHLSLDPTGSISEGFLRGGANAGMRKLNCEHLFPCYDFTQH